MTPTQIMHIILSIGIIAFIGGIYTKHSLDEWNKRNRK